jgi:Ca-activated chloride channel family protein
VLPLYSNGGQMRVKTDDGQPVVLPLKHTRVDAEIAGMVSSVRVVQSFHNPYKKPIEAIYVFPLPHRAAVYEMVMQVGDREIRGVVKERDQARRTYEAAKARGKTAALLEQEQPNIFTQSVANIMPGDAIEVSLRYVEDLFSEGGNYTFSFPMVVGPRYVGGGEPVGTRKGSGWAEDTTRIPDASRITPALLEKGLRPGHDIALRLRINGGLPLRDLEVVTHRATVSRQGSLATIELDKRDSIPNKDFVVRYRLAGAEPEVGLLARRDARGGHFLLMIQPKAKMARTDVAPLEYVFVVDNSGSMSGFPIQQAKAVVSRCLNNLTARDKFQIIKFAGSPDQFAPEAVPATKSNIETAINYVDKMQGGGGTEFIPALKLALGARKSADRSRIVLFITDGYIGYESEVLKFLRENGKGSNLFALGVGSSVNRYLIDGMARIGVGQPFYLLNTEAASTVVSQIFRTISQPALTSIQIDWGGLQVSDLTPAALPDLFGERPVVVAGRYSKGGAATVTVRGRLAGKPFSKAIAVALPEASVDGNPAVAYLWARRQISAWMDIHATEPAEAPEMQKRVTALALQYGLMSRFTSMVAVDRVVRNRSGSSQQVPVPVPLPDGVSRAAAPPQAFASLSPARIQPGDPEIYIRAPRDARAVTVIFPFGESKAARYEADRDLWSVRFLISRQVKDGTYPVQIAITLEDGRQQLHHLSYTVDTLSPTVRLTVLGALVPGGRVTLVAKQIITEQELRQAPSHLLRRGARTRRLFARVMADARQVLVRLPSGELLSLKQSEPGTWSAEWQIPTSLGAGQHWLEVISTDVAGNRGSARQPITLQAAL